MSGKEKQENELPIFENEYGIDTTDERSFTITVNGGYFPVQKGNKLQIPFTYQYPVSRLSLMLPTGGDVVSESVDGNVAQFNIDSLSEGFYRDCYLFDFTKYNRSGFFNVEVQAGSNGGGSVSVPVTGITVDTWDVALEVGQTRQLIASVIPENATNKLIHWWSEYSWVATVDNNGLITATGVGYTSVTATTDDGGHIYNIHVNVSQPTAPTPPPVVYGDIVTNKTDLSMLEGESDSFTVKLSQQPTNNQVVNVGRNNTNITFDKESLTFTPENWNVEQTVRVTGVVNSGVNTDRNTVITLSSDNVASKTINVTVRTSYIPVQAVTINPASLSLYIGESSQLTATVTPATATNNAVRWSTNSDCVTINQSGSVSAVKKGTATITVATVDGNKTATCVVEVLEQIEEPKNNPPVVGTVIVLSESSDGSFSIQYTAQDKDGDVLTHKLKMDNGGFVTINPTQNDSQFTYRGSGLSTGTHTGKIQVSDGQASVESNTFTITIRQVQSGVKAELKEAKDVYDLRHSELVTTIHSVVSDGVFDKEVENQLLDDAFSRYNVALANLKKAIQKSIDFISDARKNEAVEESRVYTSAQLQIMSDSIKQEVSVSYPTRVEVEESLNGLVTVEQVNESLQGLIDQSSRLLDMYNSLVTDTTVTPNEKIILRAEYVQMMERYENIKALVNTLSNPTLSTSFTDLTEYYQNAVSVLEPLFVDMGADTEADESDIYNKLTQFYGTYEMLLRLVYTMLNSDISNVKTEVITLADGVQTAITSSNEALGVTQKVGKHFDFTADGWVRIYASLNGERGQFMTQITDRRMSFYDGETEVAYVSNKDLYITDARIINTLHVGNMALEKSAKGGMIFKWKG